MRVRYVQRSEKWLVRGWVKFVPALAYLFCLTAWVLLNKFYQPFFTSLYNTIFSRLPLIPW